MNKFVKLSLVLLITSNIFANDIDTDLKSNTTDVNAVAPKAPVAANEDSKAPVAPVAANGYIANAKARLANVATKSKNAALWTKNQAVNGAKVTKDFTVARFQKATYINADGTYNKTEVAKTAAAVVVTAAVVYGVYKLCTKNNSSEDDEDEEDFNS